MYLLGLSGLRTFNTREAIGLGADFPLTLMRGAYGGCAEDFPVRNEGATLELAERLRNLRCSGVYCGPTVSFVHALAVELLRKWEKLTPRFAALPGRTMMGGLLGQCELAKEERDVDRRRAASARCEVVPFLDTFPERPELRRVELRIARTRSDEALR